MGSASTIRENDEATGYCEVDCPTEDLLDWELFPQACDFWTKLAGVYSEYNSKYYKRI
jgi:hypothetical protein